MSRVPSDSGRERVATAKVIRIADIRNAAGAGATRGNQDHGYQATLDAVRAAMIDPASASARRLI